MLVATSLGVGELATILDGLGAGREGVIFWDRQFTIMPLGIYHHATGKV